MMSTKKEMLEAEITRLKAEQEQCPRRMRASVMASIERLTSPTSEGEDLRIRIHDVIGTVRLS